jgi:hypothetical protein
MLKEYLRVMQERESQKKQEKYDTIVNQREEMRKVSDEMENQ